MKKTGLLTIAAVMVLGLSACSGSNETNESQTEAVTKAEPSVVTVKTLNGDKKEVDLEVPFDPKRVAVMDMAALDILDQLGLEDRVVGASDTSLDYLEKYMEKEQVAALGTIKEADMEAVMASEPDVIFIGGRLAKSYDALSEIAPVVYLSIDTQLGTLESVRKMPGSLHLCLDWRSRQTSCLRDLRNGLQLWLNFQRIRQRLWGWLQAEVLMFLGMTADAP